LLVGFLLVFGLKTQKVNDRVEFFVTQTHVGCGKIFDFSRFYTQKKLKCNDPSAGSPTDTLLRLLLPLITVI
jgi:hypothetical protein